MIRSLNVNSEQEKLDGLQHRPENTRWPNEIENSRWKYEANLSYMKELHHYWLTQFVWRKIENEINMHNNFIADIDSIQIHFLNEKSKVKKFNTHFNHPWMAGLFLEL